VPKKKPAKKKAAQKNPKKKPAKQSRAVPNKKQPTKRPRHDDPRYAAHKEAMRRRSAEISAEGRDIGSLPEVADLARKERGRTDLGFFLKAYFPNEFALSWSDDHLEVIAALEDAVLRGGLKAFAMPRGSGKTTLCERAAIWAAVYGHRPFIVLIGASKTAAVELLETIKGELEDNELLAADFPEVCVPIGTLEGIANRCKGQLHEGERTRIRWTQDLIILPTIAGSAASGVIVKVAGITGRIRGMKYKPADGPSVRPSLVIIDDPQTDQSADSASQCTRRERVLAGAILGLAGPGKKIAGVMPCTVIAKGDMADRILNRKLHPRWRGTRCKMVNAFPADEKLWEKYAEIREESFAAGGNGSEATDYYRENREAMDAGAEVAWPERYEADEISGIQHAMNRKIDDEAAFLAECQNDPQEDDAQADRLTPDEIAAKLNGRRRGLVPVDAEWLVGFIDCHKELLYWHVASATPAFTTAVVDYGTWPDQQRSYFTMRAAKRTLGRKFRGRGEEAALLAGLLAVFDELLEATWSVEESGTAMPIDLCLVDAKWHPEVVAEAIRQRPQYLKAKRLMPSMGLPLGAKNKPFSAYRKEKGVRSGPHWRRVPKAPTTGMPTVMIDVNYWKTFDQARLATPMPEPGNASLFGSKASVHKLYSEHATAEVPTDVEANGHKVREWALPSNRPDNHWLDGRVGCHVAASHCGALLAGEHTKPKGRRRPKIRYAT